MVLGIRCTPSEFSYVIIEGSFKSHSLKTSNRMKYPSGYSHCELLKWFYNEIGGSIAKFEITVIGVKGTEAMQMKGKAYGNRMEIEGMIFLQAALNGLSHSMRKVNSTIAKDLGQKGKGKYLADGVDYSSIANFDTMSKNLQEAVQVALSMLK